MFARKAVFPLFFMAALCIGALALGGCANTSTLPLGDTTQELQDFREIWNNGAKAAGLDKMPKTRDEIYFYGSGTIMRLYKVGPGINLEVWRKAVGEQEYVSSITLRMPADKELMEEHAANATRLFVTALLPKQGDAVENVLEMLNVGAVIQSEGRKQRSCAIESREFSAWMNQQWGLNISCAFKLQ